MVGPLWPDTTEQHASGSLRSALWRLGYPTPPVVEVVDAHLRLSPSVAVGVRACEALARHILDGADLDETDLDARLLPDDLLPRALVVCAGSAHRRIISVPVRSTGGGVMLHRAPQPSPAVAP